MTDLPAPVGRRRTFAIISHPGRRQDHADREAPALRGSDPACRRGEGEAEPGLDPVGLDGHREGARDLGRHLGDDLRVRGLRVQPARYAGPRGLLGGHLPDAHRRRLRDHGDRRREGHRGAHAQALRGLPHARHPDRDLHQQDGPRGPQSLRPARRDREDPGPRHRPRHLADQPGPELRGHLRPRPQPRPAHRHGRGADRGLGARRRRRDGAAAAGRGRGLAGGGRAGAGGLQALRPHVVPRGPPDPGLLRQRAAQFRRARSHRRDGGLCAAAPRPGGRPARRGGGRGQDVRLRVQDPGQHGPEPPRPHRLHAHLLGQAPARHEGEARAHRQAHEPQRARSSSSPRTAPSRTRPGPATWWGSPTTAPCGSATR